MKKNQRWRAFLTVGVFLLIWEISSLCQLLPEFMLPSVHNIFITMYQDRNLLFSHLLTTLVETSIGLAISAVIGISLAFLMDRYTWFNDVFNPIIIGSQTVPMLAIAPLMVLWFGYGLLPKIILIILVCFFPITLNTLKSIQAIDSDYIKLFYTFKASPWQIFWHLKVPMSLPAIFSGLKLATSYAFVSAVISEWLGGDSGLGVYMIRVRKAYAFNKLFAVIFIICIISFLLLMTLNWLEKQLTSRHHNSKGV